MLVIHPSIIQEEEEVVGLLQTFGSFVPIHCWGHASSTNLATTDGLVLYVQRETESSCADVQNTVVN